MSRLDDHIRHDGECDSWMVHYNDDGELQAGPCSCEIQKARAELASLRRRAEDAEMMLRFALNPHNSPTNARGSLTFMRVSESRFTWTLALLSDSADEYRLIHLENDTYTGLPVLNDEARKALGGAG